MPCLLEKMFLNPVTIVTYTRHDFVGKKMEQAILNVLFATF